MPFFVIGVGSAQEHDEHLASRSDEDLLGRTGRGAGLCSSSECVRALTHKDGDLQKLRGLLLGRAESSPIEPADAIYFDTLRARINGRRPA